MARKNNRGGKGNKKAGRNKDKGIEYRKRKGIDPAKNRRRQGRRSPKSVEDLLAELSGGKKPTEGMQAEINFIPGRPGGPRFTKHGKPIGQLTPQGYFRPVEIKSEKTGKIRYVNPFNEAETIFTKDKKGRIKWVNPKFTVDPADGFARLAESPVSSIKGRIGQFTSGLEADAMYHYFPRLQNGEPFQLDVFGNRLVPNFDPETGSIISKTKVPFLTTTYGYEAEKMMGTGAIRPLNVGELAAFQHRQKMRKKFNSAGRRSYETFEDQKNAANLARRRHSVGRYRGSVDEYKAKVAAYIKQLEIELSYLDYGKKKAVRRAIIEDTLADLRKELRKTADQINPSVTGLPHKLELKIMEALKEDTNLPDQATRSGLLSFMNKDLPSAGRDIRSVRNKSILNEIQNLDFSSVGPMRAHMLKVDLMQEYLSPQFLQRHMRDQDFMQRYLHSEKTGGNLGKSRIKVGQKVLESREQQKIWDAHARQKVDEVIKQMEKEEAQELALAKKEKNIKDIADRVGNFDRVKQMQAMKDVPIESKIAQAKAAIAQERSVVDLPFETPGKITQSTAKMIEQDSFRAASVLHSSKLGYAAVGAAAIMGFAGYNQLTGRKRRVQRDLEQGTYNVFY